MVTQIQQGTETLYQCDVCKLKYRSKETAEKCEKWCTETGTCNLEIIAEAVKE